MARATRDPLTALVWLSVGAGAVTMTLKAVAWVTTGSVGLLSGAGESAVDLVGGFFALIALRIARRPPDRAHEFGHGKVEYFSAAFEAATILAAAVVIVATAVQRYKHPVPLTNIATGVFFSGLSAMLNAVVGVALVRGGKRYRSLIVAADGRHVLADMWASAGVVVGVLAVALTGWQRLDAVVAFAIAVNIVIAGGRLLSRSVEGLMDHALPEDTHRLIMAILDSFASDEVQFHDLRTRELGSRTYLSIRIKVPPTWTMQQGQDLSNRIETEICNRLEGAELFTHLESGAV